MNTPAEIARNYVGTAKSKAGTTAWKLVLLGIMAGIFIAIGGVAYEAAVANFSGATGKLIGACMFPAGLGLVLLAGSELFTGDCLMIIGVLEKEVKLPKLVRCLALVYLGNFLGNLILAFLLIAGQDASFGEGAFAETILSIASAKVSLSFGDAFFRGIVCNIIVCLAVWVSFAAKEVPGKVLSIYLPILIFVWGGFEHSVANMYYIWAGVFTKMFYGIGDASVNWGAGLLNNLLPVTLGNIVGGMAIGAVYWAIYLKGTKAKAA